MLPGLYMMKTFSISGGRRGNGIPSRDEVVRSSQSSRQPSAFRAMPVYKNLLPVLYSMPMTGLILRFLHSAIQPTVQEVLLISVRASTVTPLLEASSARSSGERVPYLKE